MEPKSIYDDLQDTPHTNTASKIVRSDSKEEIFLPHTVAVYGYVKDRTKEVEQLIRESGNVVQEKKEDGCIYFTFSTHIGAQNALQHHMKMVGSTKIGVQLLKSENKVVKAPLQKSSWWNWIGF